VKSYSIAKSSSPIIPAQAMMINTQVSSVSETHNKNTSDRQIIIVDIDPDSKFSRLLP
jgi:hypothetical protein